MQTGGLVYI